MGNCLANNYVAPEPLSIFPTSSRMVVKRGGEHPYWRLSILSAWSSKPINSTKRTEVLDDSISGRKSSFPHRKSILLAKTFLRCSLIQCGNRNAECLTEALCLSQKVQTVVQAINDSALLTEDEKKYVLNDFEMAQLSCSDDDDDDEMAKLLQELLLSYQETSTIQSSKHTEILRLQQLCTELSLLQGDELDYSTSKSQLLNEMKSLFLQLLSCRPAGYDGQFMDF